MPKLARRGVAEGRRSADATRYSARRRRPRRGRERRRGRWWRDARRRRFLAARRRLRRARSPRSSSPSRDGHVLGVPVPAALAAGRQALRPLRPRPPGASPPDRRRGARRSSPGSRVTTALLVAAALADAGRPASAGARRSPCSSRAAIAAIGFRSLTRWLWWKRTPPELVGAGRRRPGAGLAAAQVPALPGDASRARRRPRHRASSAPAAQRDEELRALDRPRRPDRRRRHRASRPT